MSVNPQYEIETALQHLQHGSSPPWNWSVQVFDRLASTNSTLWEVIDGGAAPGKAIMAIQQTAGRGQWGRQWVSPIGGLYLSAFWPPNIPAVEVAQLTLCSAWGLAIALRECGIPVRLKWLNDLMVEGRKLGGILTETRVKRGIVTHAVVGVGINWTNPVPETGITVQEICSDQKSSANCPTLAMLAATVLQGLARGWQRCQQSGIEAIVPEYEALLVNLGQSIAWEGRSGQVAGVEPNGNLRVCWNAQTGESQSFPPGSLSLGYPIDANDRKSR